MMAIGHEHILVPCDLSDDIIYRRFERFFIESTMILCSWYSNLHIVETEDGF